MFVSHNMAAIEALSSRCILLQSGNLIFDADTRSTVAHYFQSTTEQKSVPVRDWKERAGTGEARIVKFATLGQNEVPLHVFRPGEPIKMLIGIEFQEALVADVAVVVETATERALFSSHLSDHCELRKSANYREFTVLLSPNHLRQGQYLVSLAVFTEDMHRFYDAVYHFPAFAVEGHPEALNFPLDGRWGNCIFILRGKSAMSRAAGPWATWLRAIIPASVLGHARNILEAFAKSNYPYDSYVRASRIGQNSANEWIRKSAEIEGWLFEGSLSFCGVWLPVLAMGMFLKSGLGWGRRRAF